MSASDEIDLRNEDRLPWLETVEPDEPAGPGAFRVVALVLLGLAILSGVIFAGYKLKERSATTGNGDLIAAQPGDYKVKPDEPGGLKVSGEGDSAIATSAGANSSAAIDLKAVPEAPITGHRIGNSATPATAAGSRTVATAIPSKGAKLAAEKPLTAPRATVPGAGSGGSLVQLGAYPTEAAANAAWSAIAKRFGYVATLGKSVEAADVNEKKVFRLRVNAGSANAAADICGRLKVAGESCFVTS